MHIIGGSRKGKVARKEAKPAKYIASLLEGCTQRRYDRKICCPASWDVARKDAKIAKMFLPLGRLHAKALRSQNMFLSKVQRLFTMRCIPSFINASLKFTNNPNFNPDKRR